MNEMTKTITFVVVAAAVALVAWVSRPSLPVEEAGGMVGQELFPDFTDPLAAASLEILEFDEDTASVRPFKVAQVNGRWSIPSHDNYPADAEKQLADVAAGLMGLSVLDVASDNPGDHELYGVVDPDPDKLSAGATGVGTRVTMKDKNDKTLLSIVIGKEVPDRDGLHYVRRTGQDPVYTVAVKTDKISARFEDWIEADLLKLNSWDIKEIEVRDYSIDELAGTLNMRSRLTFDYNDTGDPKWKLAKDLVFRGQDWVDNPKPMTEDQELDTDKLDEMRRALDDLQIVDVARKPEGLSNNLSNLKGAKEFLNNHEAVASLQNRGFYAVPWKDRIELFSNEGEIHCLTAEGARYILRFGNIAGTGSSNGKKEKAENAKEGKGDESETDDSGGGVNRFLFVMAEFDQTALKTPELEPLPEKPGSEAPEEGKKEEGEANNSADKADENQHADDAGAKAEASTEKEADKKADKQADEKADEEKSEEQKKYEAEVERIKKENKRKQDEYDEKVKKGKDKVDELNHRFADWYYIISDEVYQKIHLSRDGIIKEKEKEEEKSGAAEAGKAATESAKEVTGEKPVAEKPKPAAEKAKPAAEKPDEAAAEKPSAKQPGDDEGPTPATPESTKKEAPADQK